MRSILVVSGGEKGQRGRGAGPMKWFLCLRSHHTDDPADVNSGGVWLQSFQLLDTEQSDQDPVQEWADEVEDNIVYGVTLRREPVQTPSEAAGEQPAFACVQYRTHKVRRVKAAPLDRLVDQLLNPECQDSDYNRIFLSTYRAFTTSSALIELLFQRDDMVVNLDNTVCVRSPLLPLFHMWLEDLQEDLREPPQHQSLRLLHSHLRHRICFRRLARQAHALLKKFQDEDKPSSTVDAATAEPCASPSEETSEDLSAQLKATELASHHFMDFTAQDIAEQLTRMDAELFVKVVPFHCVGCVWSQRDKKNNHHIAPTVRATIAQFNAVTNRVITSLLCHPPVSPGSSPRCSSSPTLRARVIERWIAVAQECRQLRNFSSLRAILSALQSNAVYRLKKTWAAVSRESSETFDNLCETFPDENCVLTSREILVEEDSQAAEGLQAPVENTITAPKSPKLCPLSRQLSSTSGSGIVPYLGTYLTVLTMLDTALPDTLEGGLINFEKRRREFEILSQIKQLQASCSSYRLKTQAHISSWLTEGTLLTDQQSYELSRGLEPPVDPCPGSPSAWNHRRLIAKKISSLLSHNENSGRKTHADQISVSSSGSSGSEMEDLSSPSPLRLKLQSLSDSCQNVAEDFSSSSCSSSSPTPSSSSCSSSQADLTPLSPDSSSSSSSSVSPPPCTSPHPVYNKQGADSCIVRVSVAFGNSGNVYKSILLTSQDKTAHVVQRALEKHNLEGMSCHDFSLSQVLSNDKELLIPDKANVFYAMSTSANYDFVLRQRWRNHSGIVGTSSSPTTGGRWRHNK